MGSEPAGTVAILAASPALSSILRAVLAGDRRLRVRAFDSAEALSDYMRIAPVDLLLCDLDRRDAAPADLLSRLRAEAASPAFEAIALTRRVLPDTGRTTRAAGIGEVIVKPMSPRHLHQRVIARLARTRALPAETPAPRASGGNVVELFPGRTREPAC